MNAVLLGGNGYIGRNVTKYWMKQDDDIIFYVLSRSGKNELSSDKIKNIAVDVNDVDAVKNVLPKDIDYIVDFVGGLNDNPEIEEQMNLKPAKVMLSIAQEYDVTAMGYIGGVLGSKSFKATKKKVIEYLSNKNIRLEVVEPTLVYGNGRNDKLSKMVPVLKFFGLFSKNMKPVLVTDVAEELVQKLTK